jgi:hypothetical protein
VRVLLCFGGGLLKSGVLACAVTLLVVAATFGLAVEVSVSCVKSILGIAGVLADVESTGVC